jgi:AraC family transcriptional regulator
MDAADNPSLDPVEVRFLPERVIRRRAAQWRGLRVETVQATNREPFEYRFMGAHHLLIASERALRQDGETLIEGLPRSTLHDLTHKLTFVPAGHEFRGWQDPRAPTTVNYIYLEQSLLAADRVPGLAEVDLSPRLFFDDGGLWQTILKLKGLIGVGAGVAGYAEALGAVLAHELTHLNKVPTRSSPASGGLAGWQEKRLRDFIEENLTKDLSIGDMAVLVRLSPFHFARAFKRSFGVAPHQYHASRRIERAKLVLTDPDKSITRVAVEVGFENTGSFSASFHRLTGETPTTYRRSLT